ncbi:hypothetical protein [Micromonospora sp. CA-244673]|uniref:hypothetical protein n=1 Tax=Micromonospora sp. CA-244673 TaxID=3239958 RepID=UPI003D8EE7C2
MAALNGEQVGAVYQVLRDQALTRHEQEAIKAWGASHMSWRFALGAEDSEITANTKLIRETPEEAFADAAQLRGALLAAAGQPDYRGLIAAEAINDGNLVTVGWIGSVGLTFDMTSGAP